MNRIYWVMGGTAVGKKTLMRFAALQKAKESDQCFNTCWMADSETTTEEILDELEEDNLFIRWQWGREQQLADIAENHPEVYQEIWLVHADEKTHYQRMLGREPEALCSRESLAGEARSVRWLALGISKHYGIPFHTIDVGNPNRNNWKLPATDREPWLVKYTIERLYSPNLESLPAPAYTRAGGNTRGVMLAVESMKRHTTDEGWQIAAGLESTGYKLAGFGLPINSVNTEPIIQAGEYPGIVIVQDKREWDVKPRDFREKRARFKNTEYLATQEAIFKLTILKDSHQNPNYHKQAAEEIGCHAWIIYYHPKIVKHLAPYVREQHLIRTYHSLDATIVPEFSDERPKDAFLSGAVSGAYPLRTRLKKQLPDVTFKKHPGYGMRKCHTPEFLKLLSQYKVSICTSSMYGYALRKIMESTACGCVVVTDLPEDEKLPGIDDNLVRISPDAEGPEVEALITRLCNSYNPERQKELADKAKAFYDFRAVGKRLAQDIEQMRLSYEPS